MKPSPRPEAIPTKLWSELMEGLVDETEKLDLRDRHHAADRQAERGAHDRSLGERSVEDAIGSEPFLETARHSEDAAERPDVLSQQYDPFVTLHLEPERFLDRAEDRELGRASIGRLAVRLAIGGRLGISQARRWWTF
jgi:hypothetical protein